MAELTNHAPRGTSELQRLVHCNEALRVLLHFHGVNSTTRDNNNCKCTISTTSKARGITTGGLVAERDEREVASSLELLLRGDPHERNERYYRQLIAAIKLLTEDLDAEKRRSAQQRSKRVCADLLRFFLFLLGICAVIAFYPAC